jgi:L-lactate dehydrogenase (cytochrome)
MSRSVQPPRVLNIADLRRVAKRRLPRVVFDYIDGGAEGEWTLHENSRAFEAVTFRPRCAVAVPSCDLRTVVLGTPLPMPLILAPVGSSRLIHPRGEESAARAASAVGIPYVLSTFSGCRLEDVAAASTAPLWYQLYLAGGRDCALPAIERAQAARFSALVVTIDTAVARYARTRFSKWRQRTSERQNSIDAAVSESAPGETSLARWIHR